MKLIILILTTVIAAQANFITYKYKNEKLEKRKAFINKKVETFKSLPDVEKARKVNAFFNRYIKYASDKRIYDKKNHFAAFEETLNESIIKKKNKSKGLKGDCDDYVVAKLQALEYLGLTENRVLFSNEQTRYNKIRHVKVLTKIDGTEYVLDSFDKKFRKVKDEDLEGKDKNFWSSSLMLAAAKSNLKKMKSN